MVPLLLACAPHPAPPVPAAAPAGDVGPAVVVADPPDPGWVDPNPALPEHRMFRTAAGALTVVLADNPRILGVGELHNTADGPAVRTALSRFTSDLLPTLAPHTTDLVIETWRLDGTCGAVEEAVATQVEEQVERPEVVKDDLVLLVEAAVAANVRPHDLTVRCDEYAALLDPAGDIVMASLLRLLTTKLGDFAVQAVELPSATMVLYGGAVHNDIRPAAELAEYAYAPAIVARAPTVYTELDLYPPELVGGVMAEPAWAPLLALAGPEHVVLHQRGPRSWVLLLPTTPDAKR